MKKTSLNKTIGTLCVLIAFQGPVLYSQELRASLFEEVNQSMRTAKNVQADVLSPRAFGEAMEGYNAAKKKYNDEGELAEIKEEIATANTMFQEATQNTK